MRPENVAFNPRRRAQNIHLSSALFSRTSICTVQFVSFFCGIIKKWIERLILYCRQVKFPKRTCMAGWSCITTKETVEWRLRNPRLMEFTIIKFSADFFAPENESDFFPVAKIIFQLSLSVNRNWILIKKNDKSRQCTDYSEASLIFPVIQLITEPIEFH